MSLLGSASRPSRHGRREAEGEGRGGELRSALGTAAVRSAPVARRARGQSRSRAAAGRGRSGVRAEPEEESLIPDSPAPRPSLRLAMRTAC